MQLSATRLHLRVNGQRVELVLLVRLGFAVKVPGDLWSRAALDGGRDPDGVAGTNAQQVISHHINAYRRRDC